MTAGKSRFLHFILRVVCALALILPAALWQPGLGTQAETIQQTAEGAKVLVLNYHKIDDVHISLAVTRRDFERQMAYLSENNYHSITPDELYAGILGQGELPENPVLITFDDGYEDNYRNAYPILQKYGFKATIFVVAGFIGRYPNYLTWDQALELEKNGISIESHTVTHRSMTDLSDDELRKELVDSKKLIEERLGKKVNYIAYPTGTYNLHIGQLVREAGYQAAFTIKYGNVDGGSNVYALERVPIFHTEATNRDFLQRLHYIPAFAEFGWTKS